MRVVYLDCSIACQCFYVLVLTLTAYEQSNPKGAQTRDEHAVLAAAISSLWTVSLRPPGGISQPGNSNSNDQPLPGPLSASFDSPDTRVRRIAFEASFQSRPDTLQESSRMPDDPDAPVRPRARSVSNMTLSGGRGDRFTLNGRASGTCMARAQCQHKSQGRKQHLVEAP